MTETKSVLSSFIGMHVKVEVKRGFTVEGRLLAFQQNETGKSHKPFLMVLESNHGKCVLCGNFVKIVEVQRT